jgi:hypothetical protein
MAAKLYDQYKIATVAEVHQVKDQLNHHQLLGLKYFDEFQTRIPREEVLKGEQPLANSFSGWRNGKNHSIGVGWHGSKIEGHGLWQLQASSPTGVVPNQPASGVARPLVETLMS